MGTVAARNVLVRWIPTFPIFFAVALLAACATGRASQISPEEIPDLERRVASDPDNGKLLLRYAAALFAASRCDTASVVARSGYSKRPQDALGPLVIGQCLERTGSYDRAITTYETYLSRYHGERGAPAVSARMMLARREQATSAARAALGAEQRQAAAPGDPQVIAVLPLIISGDTIYRPLSRGLAQIMTSDLGLLQRFRMVERLQVGALYDEMKLGQSARVDQSTAARVGRLLRAGRLVQGSANLPSEGESLLESTVVLSDGQVTNPERARGRLKDLMELEKQLVIAIAENQLGYTLSQAERQLILENGTRNLTAFLAYSNGLEAEDRGDYVAAAGFYADAVQADPDFQMAQDGFEASTAATDIENASAGEVTVQATLAVDQPPTILDTPVGNAATLAVNAGTLDLAATPSEQLEVSDQTQTTTRSTTNTTAKPSPTFANKGQGLKGTIRIVFRLP
ncbi:MAG: CsgG/HfaB family protein [Gemmatimonadales bacterium]